jgi:hypothetical protein
LHLSHPTGEKSVKTKPSPDGLLVVDYGVTGRPIGIEITAPLGVPLERVGPHPPAQTWRGCWPSPEFFRTS